MEILQQLVPYLEPYKIENDWTKTIRYYNDMFWYTYSLAGMIPLLIITAYRFFYPIEKTDQYLNAYNFKKTKGHFIVKSLTFYAFYYYIIDIFVTILDRSYFDVCRFSFLVHHVPSIPLLYFINQLNYFPWWTLSVAGIIIIFFLQIKLTRIIGIYVVNKMKKKTWHAVLIAFPDCQLLNYPYLVFILAFHYNIYHQKPFNTMGIYKGAQKVFPFMYIALVTIWWTDCKNILPYL